MRRLLGKTLTLITGGVDDECMVLVANDGAVFQFKHHQDCCESVSIEDICGDVADLIGSPIVQADESSNEGNADGTPSTEEDGYGTHTWTFYRIATAKGLVVIRWYGSSNGYYSESVDFEQIAEATR